MTRLFGSLGVKVEHGHAAKQILQLQTWKNDWSKNKFLLQKQAPYADSLARRLGAKCTKDVECLFWHTKARYLYVVPKPPAFNKVAKVGDSARYQFRVGINAAPSAGFTRGRFYNSPLNPKFIPDHLIQRAAAGKMQRKGIFEVINNNVV